MADPIISKRDQKKTDISIIGGPCVVSNHRVSKGMDERSRELHYYISDASRVVNPHHKRCQAIDGLAACPT